MPTELETLNRRNQFRTENRSKSHFTNVENKVSLESIVQVFEDFKFKTIYIIEAFIVNETYKICALIQSELPNRGLL